MKVDSNLPNEVKKKLAGLTRNKTNQKLVSQTSKAIKLARDLFKVVSSNNSSPQKAVI